MVAVISFMFMVFFIILIGNNEDVRMIDEDYRRYLVNRKKESKKDKFLKEVEEYDKSKASVCAHTKRVIGERYVGSIRNMVGMLRPIFLVTARIIKQN